MSGITESKKRDFITQLIAIIADNSQLLTDKGFDPASKITVLKDQEELVEGSEAAEKKAYAAAKDATAASNTALDVAYKHASDTVDLMAGLLGKKNNLVLEIKKLRK
jgi:hypothetical protein